MSFNLPGKKATPAPSSGPYHELAIAAALALGYFDGCLCSLDNCQFTGYESDLLVVDKRLRVTDVEIKCSRADLRKDWRKAKWFVDNNFKRNADPTQPNHWPARVWRHYYAVPEEIWHDDLAKSISPASGVLLVTATAPDPRRWRVMRWRQATPRKDFVSLTAEQIRDIARLQTFRLWAAYKAAGWTT